jgi:cytochrome c oxidase subunit 2
MRGWLAPAALLATVGSAHAQEKHDFLGRPWDVSKDGHLSDWLFNVTTVSLSILFVIMVGIIVWALINHRAGYKAHFEHGVGRSHLMFTAIISSIIFFGVDGTLLYNAFADIHGAFYNFPTDDQNPLKIEVMAQQWAWNIRYPGPDGKFNTADDIVTINEMHIPVDRPVYVKLRSKDVIHSFYLPNFRTKQDAMPGTTTRVWFQADRLGEVEIGCAQHCGVNHYKMRGTLDILKPADFDAWYKAASDEAKARERIWQSDSNHQVDTEALWGWDWETK